MQSIRSGNHLIDRNQLFLNMTNNSEPVFESILHHMSRTFLVRLLWENTLKDKYIFTKP